MGKGMDLFGDEDDTDVSRIEIDPEFAKRYEHNKKREDLQRYEELKKNGRLPRSQSDSEGSDSESDGDDEFAVNDSRKNDIRFLDALIKVKKKDPILKEKDVKLFDSGSESELEENGDKDKEANRKGKKTMYLKDVVAQQLIEDGPELDEEEDEENNNGFKSYNEEQEELRRNFLRADKELEDGEDGGDLFRVKEMSNRGDDESDYEVLRNKLDECFNEEDENEKFLKDFMLNKMWEFKDVGKMVEEEVDELSDEEEELEREIRFRHEEEGVGDRVMGHSRVVEGSVRKKTSTRKLQRQSKADRMAIAELERREEVKHLKNLKKQEYVEKIKKVREIGGLGDTAACTLEEDDFEEFDPDEHDRKMKEMFGDEYYGADELDPEFCSDRDEYEGELGKPDFNKEDELLGLPKFWNLPNVESDDADEVAAVEGKQKRKHKLTLKEKIGLTDDLEEKYGQELTDELHKFDYEDTIGDLKTRFKYTKVKPKRYGLSTEEFLMMDDTDLNQYVSLKKIAPYREKEWKVPDMKLREQKIRNQELLKGGKLNGQEKRKSRKGDGQKRSWKVDGQKSQKEDDEKSYKEDGQRAPKEDMEKNVTNEGKLQPEEPTAAGKAKRKRRETKLKLPRGRQFGYGKEPPKQKHKAKH